ncbi:hypothetical protein BH09ACT7_BH09ACT7_24050 [soil metagenome]
MANRRRLLRVIPAGWCGAFVFALGVVSAPVAVAQGCPPGHQTNAYSGQCYVKGSAPTINGVPCVASHLGLCSSFSQNQQPPRRPRTAAS